MIFVGVSVIQVIFWLLFVGRLRHYLNQKPTEIERASKFVSVIICAKNEAENLKKHLPFILNQDYPHFEVIVVNDYSTDETEAVLSQFLNIYDNFRFFSIGKEKGMQPGKKFPLSIGIEAAQYPYVLLTDADCKPESDQWIRTMQSALSEEKEIVLGFGPYQTQQGSLNKWIRFEAIYTAIQYGTFALWGKPYMGVGRNLMYAKRLFFEVGGFEKHRHIASGDDDLFINEVATNKNTKVLFQEKAFIFSNPKENFKDYYTQKTRHFSAGNHYSMESKVLLSIVSMSHFLYYALFFTLVVIDIRLCIWIISIYIIRLLILQITYKELLKQFKEEKLLIWIPLFDLMIFFFYFIFSAALFFPKTTSWK